MLIAFIIVLLIVSLLLYISFHRNSKDLSENPVNPVNAEKPEKPVNNEVPVNTDVYVSIDNYEKPYATTPILNVDDYEYSMVFKNEGDRGITQATRNALMSQYPMDWTVQPPSSAIFQEGLASYKESFDNPSNNPSPQGLANLYSAVDGSDMTPPDSSIKEILQTYTPKNPQSLTTYDAADAKELIQKIYDAKGLVAEYAETGENQFTVFSTRPKDQKIVFEEAVASTEAVTTNGEDTIVVPQSNELDPFFTPSEKTRDGKWNYNSWTPGLERMFAPTESRVNWY